MWGKLFIGAISNGDEVAFERLYCPFGKVVAVVVGICKLIVELFSFNGCNELLGHFVGMIPVRLSWL